MSKNSNNLIDNSLSLVDSKNSNILENENLQKNNEDEYSTSNKKLKPKNSKKVRFKENPLIINVECWKKYNLEQTANENFENYIDEIENNNNEENSKNQTNKNDKNNRKRQSKADNVTCTCHII